MTPAPGSYCCVRTGGFYAWLIRMGTRSHFNHAFVVIDGERIIEADPGGARWARLSDYGTDGMVFAPDVLSDEQRTALARKAEALLGTPYGWTDIVRLSLRCLGLNWSWLTRKADNEAAMICSQLVAACGAAAGVDWLCGRSCPAEVTPGDLAHRIGA